MQHSKRFRFWMVFCIAGFARQHCVAGAEGNTSIFRVEFSDGTFVRLQCDHQPSEQEVIEVLHAYAAQQFELGVQYSTGKLGSIDEERAADCFRKAAMNGHVDAQVSLGSCCMKGQGVPKNYEEGVRWFRKAADQNSARGQLELGKCYRTGRGVPESPKEAVALWQRAAAQGLAEAQRDLGMLFIYGAKALQKGVSDVDVPKDYEEAQKWLSRAVAQGEDETASYYLGVLAMERWRVRDIQKVTNAPKVEKPVQADTSATIVTRKGRIYDHVEILWKSPTALMVKYLSLSGSVGVAELRFEDLPEDIQQRYGYNREAATAYEAKRQQAIAHQAALREAENLARLQAQVEAAQFLVEEDRRADAQIRSMQMEWQMEDLNSNLRTIGNSLDDIDWDLRFRRRF
jgi:TPR repeat protein